MTEKAEIGKEFRRLEKFGWKVKNFGSNSKLKGHQSGFVDLVVFNAKYFICIEVKTASTKDKFSDEQKETAKLLSSVMVRNSTFFYEIIRSKKEAQKYTDRILKGDL